MFLLFSLYFNYINVQQLIMGIVGVYLLRMFVMAAYAFSLRRPVIKFHRFKSLPNVLKYSALIIVAGSVANIILEIDKFMLGYYVNIEKVAYYGVAIYIASVIGVPLRSLHQIISPLTAKLLNENNKKELQLLYKKSSLNLLIISGFIFLVIVLNINELYLLIPEKFSGGLLIVFLIGMAKLTDNLLGNNNAILFNSDYYRMVLVLGVFLVITTVLLNIIFIPKYGINGSAFATFISVLAYNIAKLAFVKITFNMMPFTLMTLKVFGLIAICLGGFYFWEFPFHPIINIGFKTLLFSVFYGLIVYRFNFSEDVSNIINKLMKQLR
jgi:O-antigen/teichoic acid export membrane protein